MLKKEARKYPRTPIKPGRSACQNRFSTTLTPAGLARCYQDCSAKPRRAKPLRAPQKCREIESNVISTLCAKISVSFKNDREHLKTILVEAHIILNLSCDMIMRIELLKSNQMTIEWDSLSGNQNRMIWKDRRFSVQATFTAVSVITEKTFSTSMLTIKNNIIKLHQRNHLDSRITTVYAAETAILKPKYDKNIRIKHQSLVKNKSYFFDSCLRTNSVMRKFIISTEAIVTFNQKIISVNNFGLISKKIIKSQMLKKISPLAKNIQIIVIEKVCFADVFTEKTITINSKMSYQIQFFEKQKNEINISDHWNQNYRMQIQKVLNRHKNLFRNELNKFNDEIEMLISFLNKKNIIELKQASFSFIARNRKTVDEILDSLLHQSRLQKMFLK